MNFNFKKTDTSILPYNRQKAYYYASKWAFLRNNKYHDFENSGGDCTNYISQILHYSGCVMNYSKNGWFYINKDNRSPSWTSVSHFYNFITNNKKAGPIARNATIEELEVGDLVQIKFPNKYDFSHNTMVTKKEGNTIDDIYITTHSIDRFDYRLSNYNYEKFRFLVIEGYRLK
ncbi:amidase domain-containing protein [Clostridiaceae bacterium M8S5]|nr:amidase domain-containing protein [Clostridiaceae bacterium M8S5]